MGDGGEMKHFPNAFPKPSSNSILPTGLTYFQICQRHFLKNPISRIPIVYAPSKDFPNLSPLSSFLFSPWQEALTKCQNWKDPRETLIHAGTNAETETQRGQGAPSSSRGCLQHSPVSRVPSQCFFQRI